MADDHYGLFQDEHGGPVWRGDFEDLTKAKAEATRLADQERQSFFVYCFRRYAEVARLQPTERRRSPRL